MTTPNEQISEMLSSMDRKTESGETLEEEAPVEETPVEEEPVEDEGEVEEEPEDEEPEPEEEEEEAEEEPESEEEEEEEVEEDEEEEPSDELKSMREKINDLSGLLLEHGISVPGQKAPEKKEEVPKPAEIKKMSLEELQVLADDVDFDELFENRELFTKTMKGMLSRYGELIEQRVMTGVPSVVANQVRQAATLQRITDEFYDNNPDLKGVRKTVGAIATELVAQDPNLAMEKLLEESAKKTRELLKLPTPKKSKKVVKPAFAKGKKSSTKRKVKPKVSKLQSDIDEMIDSTT